MIAGPGPCDGRRDDRGLGGAGVQPGARRACGSAAARLEAAERSHAATPSAVAAGSPSAAADWKRWWMRMAPRSRGFADAAGRRKPCGRRRIGFATMPWRWAQSGRRGGRVAAGVPAAGPRRSGRPGDGDHAAGRDGAVGDLAAGLEPAPLAGGGPAVDVRAGSGPAQATPGRFAPRGAGARTQTVPAERG